MKTKAETSKTQITGFLKDGSKRVIVSMGIRDYAFGKSLIADLDGGNNIEKVVVSVR